MCGPGLAASSGKLGHTFGNGWNNVWLINLRETAISDSFPKMKALQFLKKKALFIKYQSHIK